MVGESVNWKYAGRRATCFGRDVHRNIALSTAPTYSALEVNIWTPEAQLGRGKSFLRKLRCPPRTEDAKNRRTGTAKLANMLSSQPKTRGFVAYVRRWRNDSSAFASPIGTSVRDGDGRALTLAAR